ncbi:MAG: hypothetical protein HOV87_16465 [Catenulispora sp.]|nr:hypothetical protein [Catenulispora sp.]
MPGQTRRKWAQAAMCAVALAAPLAVSGCASQAGANGAAGSGPGSSSSPSGTPSTVPNTAGTPAPASSTASPAAPATSASTSASAPASSAPVALNATGGTGVVVADGTGKVLMNGKAVDFGTAVHDPAFSPDGKKVAFIDGGGNLVVANADGSGRVEVARNADGQKWSHPTWQVTPADQYRPARDIIFFASSAKGGTLWQVQGVEHDGKPTTLGLIGYFDPQEVPPPATGNVWPSASGKFGTAVYEHDNGSSSDLYVRDDYLRQQGGLVIKNAAEPDFVLVGGSASSEGDPEVVFVRQVNGHQHVFVSPVQTSTGGQSPVPHDVTPNATADCSMPALSPDGKTVAYSTAAGVFTVSVKGSAAPKQVTDIPGFPTFRAAS